jgi:hypothetical protein
MRYQLLRESSLSVLRHIKYPKMLTQYLIFFVPLDLFYAFIPGKNGAVYIKQDDRVILDL